MDDLKKAGISCEKSEQQDEDLLQKRRSFIANVLKAGGGMFAIGMFHAAFPEKAKATFYPTYVENESYVEQITWRTSTIVNGQIVVCDRTCACSCTCSCACGGDEQPERDNHWKSNGYWDDGFNSSYNPGVYLSQGVRDN